MLVQTDGPLPQEFLQESDRTLNSLGKLILKSVFMHIHGYFSERIYPASAVEEIKAGEAKGHSHNIQNGASPWTSNQEGKHLQLHVDHSSALGEAGNFSCICYSRKTYNHLNSQCH